MKKIFSEKLFLILFLILFLMLILSFFIFISPVFAISLFSTPFGGQVISYIPEAPGCVPITEAVSVVTLGTVNIVIGQLEVLDFKSKEPQPLSLGLLSINGVPIYRLYEHYNFETPGNYVLGNYFDLCSTPKEVLGSIPVIGYILKKVIDTVCSTEAQACPISTLIYEIGTSKSPVGF
jgi:hypothetical protein